MFLLSGAEITEEDADDDKKLAAIDGIAAPTAPGVVM